MGLLLDRLSCSAAAALSNLLLGRACIFDSPFACLVLELCWIANQHAGHLSVLGVLRLGCAEERLEGDKRRLDGEDG